MILPRSKSSNVARTSVNNPCDIRGSTVILRSYEINFVCKENKNNNFIQQFFSSASPYSAIYQNGVSEYPLNVNNACCSVSAVPRGYVFYVVYALIWMKTTCPCTYVAHKKYSRSLITVEPLMSHGLFTDVLATFLDLDSGNYIAVYGRVRELSEFI